MKSKRIKLAYGFSCEIAPSKYLIDGYKLRLDYKRFGTYWPVKRELSVDYVTEIYIVDTEKKGRSVEIKEVLIKTLREDVPSFERKTINGDNIDFAKVVESEAKELLRAYLKKQIKIRNKLKLSNQIAKKLRNDK